MMTNRESTADMGWCEVGSSTYQFDATLTQTGGSHLSYLILIAPEGNYGFQLYYDNNALVGENALGLSPGAANSNEGDYTLLVNNFDKDGCYFLEVEVTETELPRPTFTANLISGCAPLTVQVGPSIDCPINYYEWHIFNRWVGKVFSCTDAHMKWNVSSESGGEYFAETGLYAYMLTYETARGPESDRIIQKDHINLWR